MKQDEWLDMGGFIIKSAFKILGNADLVSSLLSSDKLDEATKRRIRNLREKAKDDWDDLAPKD